MRNSMVHLILLSLFVYCMAMVAHGVPITMAPPISGSTTTGIALDSYDPLGLPPEYKGRLNNTNANDERGRSATDTELADTSSSDNPQPAGLAINASSPADVPPNYSWSSQGGSNATSSVIQNATSSLPKPLPVVTMLPSASPSSSKGASAKRLMTTTLASTTLPMATMLPSMTRKASTPKRITTQATALPSKSVVIFYGSVPPAMSPTSTVKRIATTQTRTPASITQPIALASETAVVFLGSTPSRMAPTAMKRSPALAKAFLTSSPKSNSSPLSSMNMAPMVNPSPTPIIPTSNSIQPTTDVQPANNPTSETTTTSMSWRCLCFESKKCVCLGSSLNDSSSYNDSGTNNDMSSTNTSGSSSVDESTLPDGIDESSSFGDIISAIEEASSSYDSSDDTFSEKACELCHSNQNKRWCHSSFFSSNESNDDLASESGNEDNYDDSNNEDSSTTRVVIKIRDHGPCEKKVWKAK